MFAEFISSETLAVDIAWKDSLAGAATVEADDKTWSFLIEKA